MKGRWLLKLGTMLRSMPTHHRLPGCGFSSMVGMVAPEHAETTTTAFL